MFHILYQSFLLVAASEMGDKTQFLAFALGARFRRMGPILLGILVATILNHAMAAFAGQYFATFWNPRSVDLGVGLLFLGFAAWTLKADEAEPLPESLRETDPRGLSAFRLASMTAVSFFLAEMGDKTQFATAALGARYGSVGAVTAGTTLGMMVSDGLAVGLGERLAKFVERPWLRWITATLYMGFGVSSLWRAFH